MLSGSFRQKWQRRFLALFFVAQYHFRMSLLNLQYKARGISRAEINARAREHWNRLCQAFAAHTFGPALRRTKKTLPDEQITAVLRITKQTLERERLNTALHTAKKRLEALVFIEDEPTQPIDLAKLKSAWHSFETGAIPRIAPEKFKSAWHSFETGAIPRIVPGKLQAARHPLKTLRSARHPKITLVSLLLAGFLLIVLFVQSGLAGPTFNTIKTISLATAPQFAISELDPMMQQAPAINASKALMRISQLDESEYASQEEYNTWAYSACSTASMTEVFNAYGHHYRITDVLKVESTLGEITPQLGLVENVGVANTAARFGFQTTWGNSWTLAQVLSYANAGRPVIVGWPPDRYSGGHIVVVVGGDSNTVDLADSSLYDRHALSVAQFMQWWGGFAAVVTPE